MQVVREYKSDLEQLAQMRALLEDVCRQSWGTDKHIDDVEMMKLALQEAATNVVRHAYDGQEGKIELTVNADNTQVCITLSHHGRSFDPSAVKEPSFDGSRSEGFGLYLINEVCDDVEFSQGNDGTNEMRLIKKLKSE